MNPTLTEVLEVIASYNIRQMQRMRNCGDWDSNKMLIRINKNQDHVCRLDTLIHEGVHAYYHSREIKASEVLVVSQTQRLMRELYGTDYGRT